MLLRCDPNFLRISEMPDVDEVDETDEEPDIEGLLVGLDSIAFGMLTLGPSSDDGVVAADDDEEDNDDAVFE